MWKSIASVVVGYIVMVVVVIITTGIASVILLDSPEQVTTAYLVANVILGFLAAIAGGFITAKMAPNDPLKHDYYLAGLVVALGLLSLSQTLEGQPTWYPWVIILVGVAGVIAGGWLQLRKITPIS